MTRSRNKADMTIIEQLSSMKEKICEDYCRFPEACLAQIKDPDKANDYLMDNFCSSCPMSEV